MIMELFWLEHKKIWRKTSTKISVFLCFAYVVIFGGFLAYQWFSFGSHNPNKSAFGNDFDGYGNIKNSQAYAKKYVGELSDETLQEMVRDYQRSADDGREDGIRSADWQTVDSWLVMLYPDLEDPEMRYLSDMMGYVDSRKLTGLYERREQAIRDFLKANGQSGEEMEYLLRINEKVKTPFWYDWTAGWGFLVGDTLPQMNMVIALFLAIVLSAVFAGEWHDNTSSLILTMKNGWQKTARAKAGAGVAFAVELFILLLVGSVVAQLFYMGTSGWDMPIQNIKMTAIASMNMLQAEIYEYACMFLGTIGYAGLVMLISASVRSNVPALLISLAAIYGPMAIAKYLPYTAQKMLDLLPLVGSSADIFRTNTLNIFGRFIWSPYLLIVVPVLIGMLCIPFAIRNWSKKMKV